jgi:hypothetical protein
MSRQSMWPITDSTKGFKNARVDYLGRHSGPPTRGPPYSEFDRLNWTCGIQTHFAFSVHLDTAMSTLRDVDLVRNENSLTSNTRGCQSSRRPFRFPPTTVMDRVTATVDAWSPLDDEQRDTIAALLSPARRRPR